MALKKTCFKTGSGNYTCQWIVRQKKKPRQKRISKNLPKKRWGGCDLVKLIILNPGDSRGLVVTEAMRLRFKSPRKTGNNGEETGGGPGKLLSLVYCIVGTQKRKVMDVVILPCTSGIALPQARPCLNFSSERLS